MRIVSLAPSNTEILFELGAGDKVIATTSLCDYPEGAMELESVGGWINPDLERVEELDPDLVLSSDSLQDRVVDDLESRGLEVVKFNPRTLGDVLESFRSIGKLVGREKRAEEMVEEFLQELEATDLGGARIYCEEWTSPPMISGNWVPGLIRRAGGEYPIEEGTRSREIDLEELEVFDPGIIILNVCGAKKQFESGKLELRDGWSGLTAVEKGEIYVVDDALLNRPGPRLVQGVKSIAEKL